MEGEATATASQPAVQIKDLHFKYGPKAPFCLSGVTADIPEGARCLLIGGNGAGKSTLLRILSGKHIHPDGAVTVLGRNSFHDTTLNFARTFMSCDWGRRSVAFAGYSCAITADIAVNEMMKSTQDAFPERRAMLLRLLCIDENWRMHQLSDGQRRRVQIFLQLLRPSKVLLLDEITTDLDVITRNDFLEYLKRDSIEHGTTVIYATHIFGGLDEWGTHLMYLANGKVKEFSTFDECTSLTAWKSKGVGAPLLYTVDQWLREERDEAIAAGKNVVEKAAYASDDEVDEHGNRTSLSAPSNSAGGYAPGRLAGVLAP